MCGLHACALISPTDSCITCNRFGLCFHQPKNDWKTSVGISPPMTVRQNAFQIWAERWWVSLPVISCHSLVFPAAQRPRGGGGEIPETTQQRSAGCGCPSACARECVSVCARIAVMRWLCRLSSLPVLASCLSLMLVFFPWAWKVLFWIEPLAGSVLIWILRLTSLGLLLLLCAVAAT